MKKVRILAFAGGLILAAGAIMAAQTSGTSRVKRASQSAMSTGTSQTTHRESGTVFSVTTNELVLARTWKGKSEKTTFAINSDTKKEPSIKQGDHVTVYYRYEKRQRVATELKSSAANVKTETRKS